MLTLLLFACSPDPGPGPADPGTNDTAGLDTATGDGGAADGGVGDGGTGDGGATDGGGDGGGASEEPLSFVVILTDDQRSDMLAPLPQTVARVFEPGLVFTRAIVNTPLCCPTRASLLSGGFVAHETGVMRNEGAQGGYQSFDATRSMAVHFQAAGYRTAFLGKYLSTYADDVNTVPPGWDRFSTLMVEEDWNHFVAVEGSSGAEATEGTRSDKEQYLTDYLHEESLRFIEDSGDQPFMLLVAHFASHNFAQPAAEDDDAFAGATWRGGAYNEADVSDKPPWVQEQPIIDSGVEAFQDQLYQDALESLLAVDRSVAGLVDALEASGRLDHTVFVFTSDNGHLFGEHRLWSKGVPFVEAARVPLAIRMPGGPAGVQDDRLISVSTDLPATLYDLAGIDALTGGQSFAPLLRGEVQDRQGALLIEGWSTAVSPDHAGLITDRYRYAEYVDGSAELYDLDADPIEEHNVVDDPALAGVRAELAAELDGQRGLTWRPTQISGRVGEPLELQLEHMGGVGEVHFQVEGELPAGLSLSDSGLVSGTPTAETSGSVTLTLTDSGTSPYTGQPHVITYNMWCVIRP